MGDITDRLFEGIAKNRERKNVERQRRIVEQQQKLDDNKRDFAKTVSEADGEAVLGTSDPAELDQRIRSHLETRRVGDAAAGDDAAAVEDSFLRQLHAEEG